MHAATQPDKKAFTSFPRMAEFIRNFITNTQKDYGAECTRTQFSRNIPRYETSDGKRCSIGCMLEQRQIYACGFDETIDLAPSWVVEDLIPETHLNNIIGAHNAEWQPDNTKARSYDSNTLLTCVLRTFQLIHDNCAMWDVPLTGDVSFDTVMRKVEQYMRYDPSHFYWCALEWWGGQGYHEQFYAICQVVGCPEVSEFVQKKLENAKPETY